MVKKRRSKAGKGPNWEREMAKTISQWWSVKGDDDLFWRTHGSGGRATMRTKSGKRTRGQYLDVAATDGRGIMLIKACPISMKRGYQAMSVQDVVDKPKGKDSEFAGWIKECVQAKEDAGSVGWLLMYKKNRRSTIVFIPMTFLFEFDPPIRKKVMNLERMVMFRMKSKMKPAIAKKMDSTKYCEWYLRNNVTAIGIPLEDFFEIFNKKNITEMVRNVQANRS